MILRASIVAIFLLMLGCQKESVACRTNVLVDAAGNAGCWAVSEGQLLMVKQRSGKYSFPGGTSEPGESAQCTAHRETWEEAGVDVLVAKLKHQFDNGFYLFDCHAERVAAKTLNWAEVEEVVWVNPQTIAEHDWRFPYQRAIAIQWIQDHRAGGTARTNR